MLALFFIGHVGHYRASFFLNWQSKRQKWPGSGQSVTALPGGLLRAVSVLPAIVLDIPNVIRYTRPSSRTRTHGTCYRWERCSPP